MTDPMESRETAKNLLIKKPSLFWSCKYNDEPEDALLIGSSKTTFCDDLGSEVETICSVLKLFECRGRKGRWVLAEFSMLWRMGKFQDFAMSIEALENEQDSDGSQELFFWKASRSSSSELPYPHKHSFPSVWYSNSKPLNMYTYTVYVYVYTYVHVYVYVYVYVSTNT